MHKYEFERHYQSLLTILRSREYVRAAHLGVWLWECSLPSDRVTWRLSRKFLPQALRQASIKDPAAQGIVRSLKAQLGKLNPPHCDDYRLNEWVLRCIAADDLSELELLISRRSEMDVIGRVSRLAADVLISTFVDAGRFAAAGMCVTDPVGRFRRLAQTAAEGEIIRDVSRSDPLGRSGGELRYDLLVRYCIRLYPVLLAAGRTEDARSLAAEAAAELSDESIQVRLVEVAVSIGQALPEHLQWLDDVSESSRVLELRRRVLQVIEKGRAQ